MCEIRFCNTFFDYYFKNFLKDINNWSKRLKQTIVTSKFIYRQQGFPQWGACLVPNEIFFNSFLPSKQVKMKLSALKMKPSSTEKWPLPHPLRNEVLFKDMILEKKSSNCKLAFNNCVSLVKHHWEIKG